MLPFEKIRNMDSEQRSSFLEMITHKGKEYGIYPLSLEQKSIWFLYKRDLGKDDLYYNIRFSIRVAGNVIRNDIVKALDKTVDSSPILKARFFEMDSKVFQYVTKDAGYFITYEKEHMSGIFNLENEGPLRCCITEDDKGFLLDIAIHHIAADGFSVGVFYEDFKKALEKQNIRKEGISYFDYALSQQTEQMTAKRNECIAYWKNVLKNAVQLVTFPTDMPREDYRPMPSKTKLIPLDISETSAVRSIIMKNRLTSYSFYLAVISNVLRTFGRTAEIVFASSYLNRNDALYNDMIGIRANMLVQRVAAVQNEELCLAAKRIQQDMFSGIEKMEIGIDEMLGCFEKSSLEGAHPCYQVLYSVRKSKHYISGEPVSDGGISCEFLMDKDGGTDSFDYDMSFSVYEYEDTSEISFSYHSGLYSDDKAQKIAEAIKASIKLIIEDPQKNCASYVPADFERYSLSLKEKADFEIRELISKSTGCFDIYAYTCNVDGVMYCVVYHSGETKLRFNDELRERLGILIPLYVDCMPYDIDGKINIRMLRMMFESRVKSLINACTQLISNGCDKDSIYVEQTDISVRCSDGEVLTVCREAVRSAHEKEYCFFGTKKTYFKLKQKYHSIEYKGTADSLADMLKTGLITSGSRVFAEADDIDISACEELISDDMIVKLFYNNTDKVHISKRTVNIFGGGKDPVGRMTDELFSSENYAAVSYIDGERKVYIRNGFPSCSGRYIVKCAENPKAASNIRKIYDSIGCSDIKILFEGNETTDDNTGTLSQTESKVLTIWKKNLNNENIGIYDKLFEIGGNSYNCMNILNDLISAGYEELKITDLFSYNSVYTLSSYIERLSSGEKKENDTEVTDLMF